MDPIRKKQEKRQIVLKKIYELASGVGNTFVDHEHLYRILDMPKEDIDRALTFLDDEGLLNNKFVTDRVMLLHKGVVVIEKGSSELSQYSGASITNNNFNAPVGMVQTGDNSITNVSQLINVNSNQLQELLSRVRQDIKSLSFEGQKEADEQLLELESELKENPKPSRIKATLSTLLVIMSNTASALALAEFVAKAMKLKIPGIN